MAGFPEAFFRLACFSKRRGVSGRETAHGRRAAIPTDLTTQAVGRGHVPCALPVAWLRSVTLVIGGRAIQQQIETAASGVSPLSRVASGQVGCRGRDLFFGQSMPAPAERGEPQILQPSVHDSSLSRCRSIRCLETYSKIVSRTRA